MYWEKKKVIISVSLLFVALGIVYYFFFNTTNILDSWSDSKPEISKTDNNTKPQDSIQSNSNKTDVEKGSSNSQSWSIEIQPWFELVNDVETQTWDINQNINANSGALVQTWTQNTDAPKDVIASNDTNNVSDKPKDITKPELNWSNQDNIDGAVNVNKPNNDPIINQPIENIDNQKNDSQMQTIVEKLKSKGLKNYIGQLDSLITLKANYKYILKDWNNSYFVNLASPKSTILSSLHQLWWKSVEIKNKNSILDNMLFWDEVTFLNMQNYKWKLVLMLIKFNDTGDLWLIQIDYDKYYKLKPYLQELFG